LCSTSCATQNEKLLSLLFLFLELFREGFASVLNSSGVAFYDETMDGVYAIKISSTFVNNHSQNNTNARNLNKLD
jgi:hypothetical protein